MLPTMPTDLRWSGEQILSIFLGFAIIAVLICALPVLVWLNQEPTCGPHDAGQYTDHRGIVVDGHGAKVYETIGVYLDYVRFPTLHCQWRASLAPHALIDRFTRCYDCSRR